MPTAHVLRTMKASHAAMHLLANGVPVYLGAGPTSRQPCLHYFTQGLGLKVYAWLEGAVWGVQPVEYHILGAVITGPFSRLPKRQA